MRFLDNRRWPISALILLAGCGGGGEHEPLASLPAGPAADYPMLIGAPFVVDGVTYTPADTLNYDQVGHAGVDAAVAEGARIAAAHRTLPVPSYVEVTALDTGRTILVRVEKRGPMIGSHLIDLTPAAAAQLGVTGSTRTPVRVRRVNPSEPERALLRRGERAPDRMDTPRPLLTVLMRKLGQVPAARQAPAMPVVVPTAPSASRPPRMTPAAEPTQTAVAQAKVQRPVRIDKASAPPSQNPGAFAVQAGAFASRERAEAVARRIGGTVSQAGSVWRVRTGQFTTRAQAEAALARVRSAGYTEARVQTAR